MEKEIIRNISKYIKYLERMLDLQSDRMTELDDFSGTTLQIVRKSDISGLKYYRYKSKCGSFKYLGNDQNEDVQLIKEANYYKKSIPKIKSNLELCSMVVSRLECTDYDSIQEVLPYVYKGAELRAYRHYTSDDRALNWKKRAEAFKKSKGDWYPEHLTSTAIDGSLVRSKSEALIYNHYFTSGCTYVYELPRELSGGIWRHPDFTILCETDWRSIILHDHQGRYGFEEDRERYNHDMFLYWQNGFVPGINIFYTFDDPKGGFDIRVVQNIIDTMIRPAAAA